MPLKKFFLLFLITLTLSSLLRAQSPARWIKYGDQSFAEKDYYGASKYFKDAMLLDSSNLEIINKYATSLRLFNDYILAEKYYAYLLKLDKNKIYKESLFWLATMQKNNAKYQEARKNFTKFSTNFKDKKTFIYLKSIQEIKSCEYAQELMKDTVAIDVKNIGQPVNTVNADFAAFQTNDSTLVFSSLRKTEVVVEKKKTNEDYMVQIFSTSKKAGQNWGNDSIKIKTTDKISQNANGSYSADKSKFYFSRCLPEQDCKIWVTESRSGQDTSYILPAPVNQDGYTSTQPNIAQIDGKEILFFVANFPNGKGKLDIWQSTINGNLFSEVSNPGAPLNSIDDELSPFYDAAEKQLYFASAWHFGLGGFDIFKTKKESNQWETPINMGYPINSSANDFYYSTYQRQHIAYLTSNRVGAYTAKSATCCNDIWHYDLPISILKPVTLAPQLKDADFIALQQYVPVKLYFHNDEPMPRSQDSTTSLSYMETFESYQKLFPQYKKNFTKGVHPKLKDTAAAQMEHFLTNEVSTGMQNLQRFAIQLLKNLEKGQRIELTVKGFASPLAKTDYNVKLTFRRIASMENYLKSFQHGILIPYFQDNAINGGYLKLIKIPFGEYKSQAHVIDDFMNTQQSIYSPDAARERRIEIVHIAQAHKDSSAAAIQFAHEIFDLGNVIAGDTINYTFHYTNVGNIPLQIRSVDNPNSLVNIGFITNETLPKREGEIKVEINTNYLTGKQSIHLQVNSNAKNPIKELTLTFEILASKK